MKTLHAIIVLVLICLVLSLCTSSCKKRDEGKDIIYQTDTLIRHDLISYNKIAPNRYSMYFTWSTGAVDSLDVPSSIIYNKLVDRPRVHVYYTYRRYKDGTYNYTIMLDKNIYIVLKEK